jgi:flagellar biosynthetic protein FlhB
VSGERTEAATPRRLAKMREEGHAPRSQDLASAIALLAGFAVLQASGQAAAERLQALVTGNFLDIGAGAAGWRDPNTDFLWAQRVLGRATEAWLLSLAPLLVALPLLGIGVGFAQGALFAPKTLFTGWGRINPLNGFKRLLSPNSLVDLVRSLAKVGIVTWLVIRALSESADRLPSILGSTDPRQIAGFVGEAALGVGMSGAQALLALAALDYAYQRWNFSRQARMSKHDVKEEHKQQEGDPFVRAQIRARQRKLATLGRQLADVPKAAVVVTNPTHIAVALQYDRTMPSPRVLAMGADLIAEKIKQVARDAGVPIVENRPLARGLFNSTQVGDTIPLELYQAVAEVLAYVFSLRRRGRV